MRLRRLSLLVLLLMVGTCAFAQTSALSGTVADPSGALIPGADVTVKSISTGVTFHTATDSSGEFTVPALATGDYSVTVTAKGFKQAQVPSVHLDVGVPASVQLTLEIGSQAEMVSVEGAGSVLQTQTATVSTTLTGRQITDLPLVSRDALDMVLFLPGTTTPGRPRTSTINGLGKDAINITLDGINVQDNLIKESDGYFTFVRPRIDAIEEVTVSTSAGGADATGEGAVQIKFVTRSGGNEYRGSLYEYLRNTDFNANYWFNNRDLAPDPATGKAPRSAANLNQYGARIGGPISIPKVFSGKNKLFFFSNYEEYRLPEAVLRNRTILSPLAQSGVFQYNASGVKSVNLLNLAAANGQTSTADPTTSALLKQIRDSTKETGISALSDPDLQRFSYIAHGGQTRRFFVGRIDYNINAKNSIETSYNYQDFAGLVDFLNNSDPAFPGFPNQGSQGSNRFSGVIAWRSTLTSRMVNELRAGLNGGTTLFFPEVSPGQFNNQGGLSLGIGAAGITSATVQNGPSRRNTPVKQVMDNLSINQGKHNLSVGFNFTQVNSWQKSQNAVPTVTMGVDTTDPANAMFTTANFPGASTTDLTNAKGIYAVLTGRVTAINANAQLSEDASKYVYIGPNVQRYQEREQGIYAQDTWRLKPTLTLTLGVRWEIQYPFIPMNQKYSVTQDYNQVFGVGGPNGIFNPTAKGGEVTQFVPSTVGEHAYKTDFSNFAPSLGMAWTPHFNEGILKKLTGGAGKTVLRAGYSLSYVREGADFFSSYLGSNPGGFINANRSISIGNLVTNTGTDVMPVLLRQPSRLGPPAFSLTPVFPTTGIITDQVNVINPDLKMPYVHSWNISLQRELTKDTVLEVRYVGNRQEQSWGGFQYNETNIVENGMLSEFLLAQQNFKANIAAGRGNTFKYFGPGTGTSPLPITLAYFSGIPAAQAGDATKYSSSNFASTTWTNTLGSQNPTPFTYVSGLAGSTANAAFRANAITAGLASTFFVTNPDKLGGAFDLANWGGSHFHGGIIEVRRRFSKGLLMSANYALSHSYQQIFTSFRQIDGQQGVSPNAITHAFKMNWIYELPFGRGKMLLGGSGRLMDALVGGWAIDGTGRVQTGSPINFGNVRLVGMTRAELQDAMGPRKTGSVVYYLPQDIIDNTIRANNFDPTSSTGFSAQGVPTGRYIAPANGPNCIELYAGQCGGTRLMLYGPMFTRFDVSMVKRVKINERVNFELRGEALNAFNNIDFLIGSASNDTNSVTSRSGATFGQITNAYQDTSTTNDPGGRLIQLVARFNF